MKTRCTFCKQELEIPDDVVVGQHVRCSQCGHTFGYGIGVRRPSRIELPTGAERTAAPQQPKAETAEVSCPSCQTHYEVGRDVFGQEVQCDVCGSSFVVGQRQRPRPAPKAAPNAAPGERKRTLVVCTCGMIGAFAFYGLIVGLVAFLIVGSGGQPPVERRQEASGEYEQHENKDLGFVQSLFSHIRGGTGSPTASAYPRVETIRTKDLFMGIPVYECEDVHFGNWIEHGSDWSLSCLGVKWGTSAPDGCPDMCAVRCRVKGPLGLRTALFLYHDGALGAVTLAGEDKHADITNKEDFNWIVDFCKREAGLSVISSEYDDKFLALADNDRDTPGVMIRFNKPASGEGPATRVLSILAPK